MFFNKKKTNTNILDEIRKEDRLEKFVFVIIGCFLIALAFNLFFSPYNIVTGGVSGISIIVYNVTGLSTTTFIIITYILLLILSYFVLGKKSTRNSLVGSILYPLFVFLTEDIGSYIQFNVNDNIFLVVIFGGLLSGIGSALTFKYGFSTGGSDIILQIMAKKFKMSIGHSMKIFNFTLIALSGFFISSGGIYAWENVFYAIIAVYITSFLNDKVMLGISDSKSFHIITEHETSIKSFIMNELNHGVTVLEGRGGYTGDRKKVILCVIPTKQYFVAKEGILKLDKDAVILVNDVYQSEGIE